MDDTTSTKTTGTTCATRTCLVTATIAGVTSTAGVVALFVGLSAGHAGAIPVPDHGAGPIVATAQHAAFTAHPRPCFMVRPRWNTALDGPQPTC